MGDVAWKAEVLLTGSWRGATSVLLSHGDFHVVVDTGLPHEAHQLLDTLKKKGHTPSDIAAVINTHFHIDHVLNNALFPSSVIYGAQESYEWCRNLYGDLQQEEGWKQRILKYYPEIFEYDRVEENMSKMRKLTLRWWDVARLGSPSQFRWTENHRLPEGIESLITHGHVPGHISLIVGDTGERTVVAGDALLTRVHNEQIITMVPHNRKQFHLDCALILSFTGRIIPGHDREFTLSRADAVESGSRPDR